MTLTQLVLNADDQQFWWHLLACFLYGCPRGLLPPNLA
jgi:hypothetical protein